MTCFTKSSNNRLFTRYTNYCKTWEKMRCYPVHFKERQYDENNARLEEKEKKKNH